MRASSISAKPARSSSGFWDDTFRPPSPPAHGERTIMAFPPGFLDELRSRISLSGLVGRRVKLVRRGREFAGLCPFHHEKTPSFYVVEDKSFFHCFGCGAHGDVIGFAMRADNLDFIEAIERLAGEAGLTVPQATPQERERAQRQKTLLEATEAAATFYEQQLWRLLRPARESICTDAGSIGIPSGPFVWVGPRTIGRRCGAASVPNFPMLCWSKPACCGDQRAENPRTISAIA